MQEREKVLYGEYVELVTKEVAERTGLRVAVQNVKQAFLFLF